MIADEQRKQWHTLYITLTHGWMLPEVKENITLFHRRVLLTHLSLGIIYKTLID